MSQSTPAIPSDRTPPSELAAGARNVQVPHMSLWRLFRLFVRIGLVFGSGTAMSAAMQREIVDQRGDLTRTQFMALYGLARVVPSGSSTALAVAFGYRYQKFLGTVVVLVAMILPSFALTVLLTIGRDFLIGSEALTLLNLTLIPAALAVVIVSTWKLAQEFFTPSVELVLAIAAFLGVFVFGINPPLVLIAGGIVGAIAIRERNGTLES